MGIDLSCTISFQQHDYALLRNINHLKSSVLTADCLRDRDKNVFLYGSRMWMHVLLAHTTPNKKYSDTLLNWLAGEKENKTGTSTPDVDSLIVLPGAHPDDLKSIHATMKKLSKEKMEALPFADYQNFSLTIENEDLDITIRSYNRRAPVLSNYDIQIDIDGNIQGSEAEKEALARFIFEDSIEIANFQQLLDNSIGSNEYVNKGNTFLISYLLKSLYKPLLIDKKLDYNLANEILSYIKDDKYKGLRQACVKKLSEYVSAGKIPEIKTYYEILEKKALEDINGFKDKLEKTQDFYKEIKHKVLIEQETLHEMSAITISQYKNNRSISGLAFIEFTLGETPLVDFDDTKICNETLRKINKHISILQAHQEKQSAYRNLVLPQLLKNNRLIEHHMLNEALQDDEEASKTSLNASPTPPDDDIECTKENEDAQCNTANTSPAMPPKEDLIANTSENTNSKKKRSRPKRKAKKSTEESKSPEEIRKEDINTAISQVLAVYDVTKNAENFIENLYNDERLIDAFRDNMEETITVIFTKIKERYSNQEQAFALLSQISPLFPKNGFRQNSDFPEQSKEAGEHLNKTLMFQTKMKLDQKIEVLRILPSVYNSVFRPKGKIGLKLLQGMNLFLEYVDKEVILNRKKLEAEQASTTSQSSLAQRAGPFAPFFEAVDNVVGFSSGFNRFFPSRAEAPLPPSVSQDRSSPAAK